MTGPVDASGLGKLLSDTMAALDEFQQGAGEPPTGAGTAADGMVVVRTELPGRVTEMVLDPRVMRWSSQALAEEVTAAVNASLADLQANAGVPGGGADLGGLGERLREIQERTGQQLSAFTNQLVQAQEMLVRCAGDGR
ncbi:YbaB/EbfC family DNA-binding protein [Micromonospora sp. WMMD1120]|uniref:YbaB/EbfC family DNA-binding protein n=1 Tax=Micromonospora sp. WMMD1120 TaxID=3016106 RepID=UPI002416388C|nr:YbaB/EbfC family DNA-binding protein [Micromonospora sp. WMMD1120]MDG4810132.1 YbaB/EbfC family DNA-binding protein [Micromonospora sp. WMMD1120]